MSQHEDDSHAALSYAQINTFFECKDGVSIGFIAIVALGILTMWYILFTKITMGRRKRDLSYLSIDDSFKAEDAFESAAAINARSAAASSSKKGKKLNRKPLASRQRTGTSGGRASASAFPSPSSSPFLFNKFVRRLDLAGHVGPLGSRQ